MAFTSEELAQLESLVNSSGATPAFGAEYRSRFPGRSLTRCDVSDMGTEQPYKQLTEFDLYFLDAHDHCAQISTDPKQATGIVLAKHKRHA